MIRYLIFTLLFFGVSYGAEGISFKGDVRYRHETIDDGSKAWRNRHRLRGRLGAFAKPTESLSAGIQLISGSSDPVSGNQSLDTGFSTKTIGIDLLYLNYKFSDSAKLTMGKMKNPFAHFSKAELIWDGDLTPEGIDFHYSPMLGPLKLDGDISFFWVEERSADPDSFLIGLDLKTDFKLGEKMKFIIAVGYFAYTHMQGQDPIFDTSDSFGNVLDGNSKYSSSFRLFEGSIGLSLDLAGKPMVIFYDLVVNTGATGKRFGWLTGLKYGSVKKAWDWAARYNYRRVDADAILGAFADSDFRGGGSDGSGHEIGLDLGIAEKLKSALSFFANSTGVSNSIDYFRLQLDFSLKL